MRLRRFLILIFFLVALTPSALFWAWPYSKALDSEINDVSERHLVIAKNLATAFERYYKDVTSAFAVLSSQLGSNAENPAITQLLDVYNFRSVMLVSGSTGEVLDCIIDDHKKCRQKIGKETLDFAKLFSVKGKVKLSTVVADKMIDGDDSILLAVMPLGDNLAIGCLSTRYIVELGQRVKFGQKGHAAVVDQLGNILAHPLTSWRKSRKNIAKVSAVKKMLAGKTGVEIFYSPALKGDMIAGYTTVANAGWGVMIPQPIDELHNKAKDIDRTALFVMILGLCIALVIAIPVSFIITSPLERLSKVTKIIGRKDTLTVDLHISDSRFVPLEVKRLNNNFKTMIEKLQENRVSITQLAYIDMNTGLPNRNYFHKLTQYALKEMSKTGTRGAILFIDFDGFKQVNDTYGHRTGDELLALFAKRVMTHFLRSGDINHNTSWLNMTALPEVIPARLGGDEFVVLFKHIPSTKGIKARVEELLVDIFGKYSLYGNVQLMLSGSVGVALFPEHGNTYEEIIKAADMAMYEAKAKGKNTVSFFKP